MPRVVELPPDVPLCPDGTRLGGWWHDDVEEGRIVCDLCPRECHLRPGDRGFCFVRENRAGEMVLSTYGRSTGFCIDPIEKKPLNHFYPGTSVLSFGTAGCNLACKFCQNWSISKSREIERLSESATPEAIATAALELGCRSVAFTYNDPVIWAEYAIDAARACRAVGIKTVAVTAGYITPVARRPFYEVMDAANVDLKGFSEEFYKHLTLSHLQPVLDTLRWLKHESDVWFEITNLIIPQANDSGDEIRQMCDWILDNVGPDVPVHFTAFHPDFKMMDREPTPPRMLHEAYELARAAGLNYVYAGNIHSPREQTTYCPGCKRAVIERNGYTLGNYAVDCDGSGAGRCTHCGTAIPGHFEPKPGNWGSRRQPVRIANYANASATAGIDSVKTQPMLTQISPAPEPAAANTYTPEQEDEIVRAAARHVAAKVTVQEAPLAGDLAGAATRSVLGAFVTLKRAGRLRSCCGFLGTSAPLAEAIAHAAARTATEDHRFPPIDPAELKYLEIDVWLLENMQRVSAQGAARKDAITIGKHGLQIVRGEKRGLLLPGVAVENGFDAETFLHHVCLKADLPPTAWREEVTELSTFEGHSIHRPFADLISESPPNAESLFTVSQRGLGALADFCRGNIVALANGATPNYFAFGLPDANVNGVIVSVRNAGRENLQTSRIALRDKLPLQSTLFNMCESLAQSLQTRGMANLGSQSCQVELVILGGVTMHGSVAEPDLRGIETGHRSVVVVERTKVGAVFAPSLSPQARLEAASSLAQVTQPRSASVYSLATLTQLPEFRIAHGPRPVSGSGTRAPAVAGKFYPADANEFNRLVDRCLHGEPIKPRAVPAVMAPHAGLIYSGHVAGEVFRRVQFPKTIIVIGPKHTRHGVDWAVAPHENWAIPGATIPADPRLGRELCVAIPGLELDAAAHAQEHAIEVELPFLARLAPQSRVVGIVIGAGDLARCREFATGLANVLRQLPEMPLLVISSDMNHFASDAETRRLDDIALRALETLDPAELYETVTRQHISMCGLLPAVIVLETLRQLGSLKSVERIAYATSADVTGDTRRVVGYSGLLLS